MSKNDEFAFKIPRNCALKTRNCVSKTRNFASKMVIFAVINKDSNWVKFTRGDKAFFQNTGIKGLNSLKMPREGIRGEKVGQKSCCKIMSFAFK